jgi:phosphate transport system protein
MPIDLESNLTNLRKNLLNLGAKVEQRLYMVTDAIRNADAKAAKVVKGGDEEIDIDDLAIEEECVRLLALAGPVASDLRNVLTIMRISGEFERVADLSKGISKRVIRVSKMPAIRLPDPLIEMCTEVRELFSKTLKALADMNVELAREIRTDDDVIDRLHKAMIIWAREEIPRDPDSTNAAIELLAVAQRLERTGDIAVSIAGNLIYLVEGNVVRHGDE